MSTAQSPDYSPPVVNAAYEMASYHVGKSLVDVIRSSFTGGKIRSGDYYFSRSRPLIQQYYLVLPSDDQNAIHVRFQGAVTARERIESANGFRKFFMAKEYEQTAKILFEIVETASRRAADQNIMAQISEALGGRAFQPPAMGTVSTLSNPFSDSHEASSLANVDVGNLDQVEMTLLESEATGEAAVVLELHGRDGITQEFAATIPLAVVSGDRTDGEAETASLASYDSVDRGIYGLSNDDADRSLGRAAGLAPART